MNAETYLVLKQAFLPGTSQAVSDEALLSRVARLRDLTQRAKAETYLAFKIQTMAPDLPDQLMERFRQLDEEVARILERVLLLDQSLEETVLEWDMGVEELRPMWDFSLALLYEAYLETRQPKIYFFQQVKSLFQRALEVEPHQWQTFLGEHCAHLPELQKEVQALLLAHVENERNLRDLYYVIKDSGPSLAAGRKLGKYQIERFLGKGGMGEVYLATRHNPNLSVAVKVLKPGWFSGLVSPRVTERFLAFFRDEMQTLADLDHPRIAKFIDSGTTPGKRPYIVMAYIDGEHLTDYCNKRELGVRERLDLFLKTCDAVQHAHNRDIVHSDLKPGNILVMEDGEISLLDFGISRNLAKGHRLGGGDQDSALGFTPPYAAPEQLRYKPPTRKSDIHALGVILFELLSGCLPYEGETRDQLLFQQPKRLRSVTPNLPEDLEVIISACLQKEEQDRYGSLQGLSRDLERHLAGKPISLRVGELGYVLGLRLRKYKWRLGFAALISTAFMAIFGILALRGEWVAQLRESSTAIERDIVITIKDPPRDLSSEWLRFEAQVTDLENWPAMRKVLVAGEWHAALGKVYYAMKDYPKAREHLEIAFAANRKNTEVSLALCYTFAVLYREELRDPKAKQGDWHSSDFKEKSLRLAENADSEQARKIKVWLTYFERGFQSALEQIEAIDTPWDFEVQLLLGDISTAAAAARSAKGHDDEAMKLFNDAEAAYQSAAQIRRADVGVYLAWSDLYYYWMSLQSLPRPQLDRCLEEGERKSKIIGAIAPSKADSYLSLSKLHYRYYQKVSDKRSLKLARKYIDLALELEPRDQALTQSSAVWWRMAEQKQSRAYFEKALEDLERVQEPSFRLFSMRGIALGQAAAGMGEDAPSYFRMSERAYKRAIEIRPEISDTYSNMGVMYRQEARYQERHCANSTEAFQKGARSFEKALAINPNRLWSHNSLGNLRSDWAESEFNAGLDPWAQLQQARLHQQDGLALASEDQRVQLWGGLGWTYYLEGVFLWNSGKDTGQNFDLALDFLEKARSHDPENPYTLVMIGRILETQVLFALRSGENPDQTLKKAMAHQQLVLGIAEGWSAEPRLASLYLMEDRYRLEGAGSLQNQGKIEALIQSIEMVSPIEAARIRGELALQKGEAMNKAGMDPRPHYEAALQSLSRVEKVHACDPSIHMLLARRSLRLAEWLSRSGKPFEAEKSVALSHLDRALQLNPTLADIYLLKAELCLVGASGKAHDTSNKVNAYLLRAHELNAHLDHLAVGIRGKLEQMSKKSTGEHSDPDNGR